MASNSFSEGWSFAGGVFIHGWVRPWREFPGWEASCLKRHQCWAIFSSSKQVPLDSTTFPQSPKRHLMFRSFLWFSVCWRYVLVLYKSIAAISVLCILRVLVPPQLWVSCLLSNESMFPGSWIMPMAWGIYRLRRQQSARPHRQSEVIGSSAL
jgi:hypothetical protein